MTRGKRRCEPRLAPPGAPEGFNMLGCDDTPANRAEGMKILQARAAAPGLCTSLLMIVSPRSGQLFITTPHELNPDVKVIAFIASDRDQAPQLEKTGDLGPGSLEPRSPRIVVDGGGKTWGELRSEWNVVRR